MSTNSGYLIEWKVLKYTFFLLLFFVSGVIRTIIFQEKNFQGLFHCYCFLIAYHSKNIQINEPLYFVEVFQACLFGTAQTNLSNEKCEKDNGGEKGKNTLNSYLIN